MQLRNIVAAGVAALGLFAAATSANALLPTTTTTYTFSGECSDCKGTGTGTLVLQNYTPGDPLLASNVISFDYISNLVDYSFIEPSVSGSLTNLPGRNGVSISGLATENGESLEYILFYSNTDGAWRIGPPAPADFGSAHVWNGAAAAPEPSEWALMILGVGGGGAALRLARRRRVIAAT